MDLITRLNPVKSLRRNNQVLVLTSRSDSVVLCLEDLVLKFLIESGFEMSELDKGSPSFDRDLLKLNCAEDIYSADWIQLESGELFEGKHIDIRIREVDYVLTLDKKMIGVRLKKTEFENISYRIKSVGSKLVLSLKKEFKPILFGKKKEPLIGTGYTLVRTFLIV